MLHSVFLTLSSAVKIYYIVTISFLLLYNTVIFRAYIYLDISAVIPRAPHGYNNFHVLLLKNMFGAENTTFFVILLEPTINNSLPV